MLLSSNSPKEPQHRHHRDNDAGKRRADCDDADCLLLEGIKPGTEGGQLRLHAVSPILAPDDDLQGKEAAVELGQPVADVLAADVAALGKVVDLLGWSSH